ncbi:hypothetical protein D7Y15_32755 [Corallococcus sp. AB030]|uniref:hypothetical protein n=1 Tax=Corallococcus sp. AB030 TaxID=2316716 RepID=UPI000EE9B6EF|nr:hypothetical protein [Corallococcus sp. AB030]RKI05681.1 hypothetical protein D7Y15_32755 [Corallococcus sp. AB030]
MRHPDEGTRLFGDTLSLSGYSLDGTMYLLGQLGDGRSVLASWRPRWTGEDLEEGPRPECSPVIDEGHTPPHAAWAREAARYAVIFGLLLEAEGSRLGIEEAGQREAHEGLPVRTVYLRGPVAVPPVSSETGFAWSGAMERQARGYLTRQRHGPWLSLARWQFVSKRSMWRWVRPAS